MAASASKSKLYALRSELSEWRKAGKSHAEIAEWLLAEKGSRSLRAPSLNFSKAWRNPQSRKPKIHPPFLPRFRNNSRIESGLEAIWASLALANSAEPPPVAADPNVSFGQIEGAIDKLSASLFGAIQAAEQAAAARHEALAKTLAAMPSQMENLAPKNEPPRLPQLTIPKAQDGRIWRRAVILTSLFWLLIWQLTK